MPVVANGEIVLSKRIPGGKPHKALEKHGREGWYRGEPVTFYQGVGWVSRDEREEACKVVWPSGTVFASRHSRVPLAEPVASDTLGWMQFQRRKGRTRVIFLEGGWEELPRRSGSSC